MIDLLVISHACVEPINRVPFQGMEALGWRTEIATAAHVELPGLSKAAKPRGVGDPPMHFLPLMGKSPRLFRFKGLLDLLEARRPRVVLLDYDPGTILALEVGAWARLRSAHLVCFSYDNLPRTIAAAFERQRLKGVAFTGMVRALSTAAGPLVDHVFALSNDSLDTLRSLGFGSRMSKIPLGFDPTRFRPNPALRAEVRTKLGLKDVTVAYFGRLSPEKGVHLLLEALAGLADRPWQLLLDRFAAYTHSYTEELEGHIDRLGLRSRIVFFDATHAEMPGFMNAADIVALPSIANTRWREQYGRVAPEAMACGRLVVASTSGALPELVSDAGLLVPPNDVAALRRALDRAMSDEGMRVALGARAERLAREERSLRVQVQIMDRVFRRWGAPTAAPTPDTRASESLPSRTN
ncbi:MAG TPA: glycosyltransferase family 4 protein [Polyangiaceae bacterium]|nr:glycosyltransferase family 4 protein [Polyangiaceae bacterium]